MKTISCLITCYNLEKLIKRAIFSVLRQTGNFILEIIVVDDGSTDNSVQVIKQFGAQVQAFYRPHAGLMETFIFGIKHCTGDYICFCDSDDLFLPGKLELQLWNMERHPEVGICGTLAASENRYTKPVQLLIPQYSAKAIRESETFDGLLRGRQTIVETTYFIRKLVLDGFDLRILYLFHVQDYPILYYLVNHSKILVLDEVTAIYSLSKGSHSRPAEIMKILKYQIETYKIRLYFMVHYPCKPLTPIIVTYKFLKTLLLVIIHSNRYYGFLTVTPLKDQRCQAVIG